jgi:hypothetical protein
MPDASKEFILSTCWRPSDDIVDLKRHKDEWEITIKPKDPAVMIANAMKVRNSPIDTNIRWKRFFGVVCFLDIYEAADVANLFTACERTKEIGKSQTFKLH